MIDNDKNIDIILNIAKKFGATKLLLFGSALDSLSEAQDIDLAVDGVPGLKVFEMGGELELALKKKVDLIPMDKHSEFFDYISKHCLVLI